MMHLYFLADLNRATPALVALSGTATNTKWFLSLSGVAIASILITVWIVKKFIKNTR
jgi:flagellar biogenesis protein FliO